MSFIDAVITAVIVILVLLPPKYDPAIRFKEMLEVKRNKKKEPVRRCAECDCKNGEKECTWIKGQ